MNVRDEHLGRRKLSENKGLESTEKTGQHGTHGPARKERVSIAITERDDKANKWGLQLTGIGVSIKLLTEKYQDGTVWIQNVYISGRYCRDDLMIVGN